MIEGPKGSMIEGPKGSRSQPSRRATGAGGDSSGTQTVFPGNAPKSRRRPIQTCEH